MSHVDLDRLDRLHAAASRGYSGEHCRAGLHTRLVTRPEGPANEVSGCDEDGNAVQIADFFRERDTQLFVALHEAYPALRDELRAARELLRQVSERDIEHRRHCPVWFGGTVSDGGCTCGLWEIEKAIDEATK